MPCPILCPAIEAIEEQRDLIHEAEKWNKYDSGWGGWWRSGRNNRDL